METKTDWKYNDIVDNKDMNRIEKNIESLGESVGDLENLSTENKNDLVSAINEVFTLGNEKKQKLVTNLIAMGVTCTIEDTWETLLKKILDIFTGTDVNDTTATEKYVVKGYKFHTKDGSLATGTMTNNSAYINATACWQTGDSIGLTYPTGAYLQETSEGHTTLCVSTGGMAYALGVDGSKMLQGYTVSGVEGSIPVSREWMPTTHWWLDTNNNNLCFNFKKGAYLLDDGGGNGCGWIDAPHVRDVYGITGDKIAKGQSICGVTGEYEGAAKYATGNISRITKDMAASEDLSRVDYRSGQYYGVWSTCIITVNLDLSWTPKRVVLRHSVTRSNGQGPYTHAIYLDIDSKFAETEGISNLLNGDYNAFGKWSKGFWINGSVVKIPSLLGVYDNDIANSLTWEAWG